MFHDISEMNPAEIEETIKCHVQSKIDEYDIDATIIAAVVVGNRCRGLEKDSSDLDVVVELSMNEREDEAIAIWKQIPPEQMHGIPAIGINVHRPGEENYMDDEVDLLSGNRIDLEIRTYPKYNQ